MPCDRTREGRVSLDSTVVLVPALWVMWSTTFIAIKWGLTFADPLSFTVLRVASAVVALVVVKAVRRQPRGCSDALPHAWGIILGATSVAGFLAFQNLGLQHASVGVGSMIIYTQPLLVALGAWLVRGERLRRSQTYGLLIGWSGVVVLVGGELDQRSTSLRAIAYLLVSATLWAAGTLAFTAIPASVPVMGLLLLMNAYGSLLLLVALLAGVGPQPHVEWGVALVASAAWAGAAASVGGIGVQFLLLRRGKAGVVTSWTFAVPVLAAAEGVVVLGEGTHTGQLLGSATVVLGLWVVNRRPAEPWA